MKNISELLSCGHLDAEVPRIYTSHSQAMKLALCQPCHQEFTSQLGVIERIPDEHADDAYALLAACGVIRLGGAITLHVLNAFADAAICGHVASCWPYWCKENFTDSRVAIALMFPMNDALVLRAREAHVPTIRIPESPGVSAEAKGLIALGDARWTISQEKEWAPLVQLIHKGGVEKSRIQDLSSSEEDRRRIADRIEAGRRRLNASTVIMISDVWVGAPGGKLRPSESTNSTEALMVAVWGADRVTILGSQNYSRNSAGNVFFDEFKWAGADLIVNKFAGIA